ncbi:MAG TPA: hypothetical protein VJS44_13090 [Pyrinomonadaceae bacterium]|nr:hypothetical protein [Pyrinomonadaceae bacterium]
MRRALFIILLALVPLLFPAAEALAHPSWGIAVDNQGQVYFSDLKTVWKIDARGAVTVFRAEGDRHTHELNVDEAGNVYGADNSYEPTTKRFFSAIWKMTPAGSFSYLLPLTDDPPEGISIWRDRDGNSYHAANYPGQELLVLKRSPDGQLSVLAGNSDAARQYKQGVPYGTGGMAFGPDGALYFTHGANVSKVAPGGALSQLARNLTIEKASGSGSGGRGGPTQLFGIAVDAQGNAFVADYGNRRVLKIAPNGQTSTVLQAEESWFPTGVALKGAELYILEIGQTSPTNPIGTRVRRLSPDGRVSTLATVGENRASSGNASDGQGASDDKEREAGQRRSIPYALIGAGVSIFALIVIVGLALRKASVR